MFEGYCWFFHFARKNFESGMCLRVICCVLVSVVHQGCDGEDEMIQYLRDVLEIYQESYRDDFTTTRSLIRVARTTHDPLPNESSTLSLPTGSAPVLPVCTIDPLGVLSEIPDSPSFEVLGELGKGQTGTVLSVQLSNGDKAALKCACVSGRFLLNDYGALLDLQPTNFVPQVWGYYKRRGKGDCYFMSLLGPSLRTIRQKTTPRLWPARTIATLGLLMLSAIEAFATPDNGYILHGDAFAGNLVVGPSSNSTLSTDLYFIDFDLSKRKYIPSDFYSEVRQVLYTLRFLVHGDESSQFFQIVDHRSCHDKYAVDCPPAYPQLCEAIAYACAFNGVSGKRDDDSAQEIDLGKIRTLLRSMLDSGQDDGHIFWPQWIKEKMKNVQ